LQYLPLRLVTSTVLLFSCVITVMADEARWEQYLLAGEKAYHQGDYAEAVRQTQHALKEAENFGEEDPGFAVSLDRLGRLYQLGGRYAEAERLFKHSLGIWETVLGPEHDYMATILSNLAELYRMQSRYAEAEPLYKRSLAILEKMQDPEHSDVAMSLNNLAWLYDDQGRHAEAEPLFKRSLKIWETVLGSGHLNAAIRPR